MEGGDFIDQGNKKWKAALVRERFEWKDAKDILAMELPQPPRSDFI